MSSDSWMTCETCGTPLPDTPFWRSWFRGGGTWYCPQCVDDKNTGLSRSHVGVVFCEGNPGHGPITVARARWQDARAVHRHTDGSTEVYQRDKRA